MFFTLFLIAYKEELSAKTILEKLCVAKENSRTFHKSNLTVLSI